MRTLESGRTYCSVVPKPVLLPDENLLCVFEHLDDPFNLARIEIVSRQWHHVARGCQHLWRNATGIDMAHSVLGTGTYNNDNTISPARTRHLIDTLCARSGGVLDRLAIVLPLWTSDDDGVIPDVEDIAYIVQTLPTLRLKELWLEAVETNCFLSSAAATCERSEGYNNDLDLRLLGLVSASLQHCEHLTELHMDVNNDDAFDRDFVSSLASTPLSTCRLLKFSHKCDDVRILLENDSFCGMLQSATHIRLDVQDDFPLDILLRLLQSARATVEDVKIICFAGWILHPVLGSRLRLHLPCLKVLVLDARSDKRVRRGIRAFPFQLVCTALTQVDLQTKRNLQFLKALLGPERAPIAGLLLGTGKDRLSRVQTPAIVKLLSDRCGSTLQTLVLDGDAKLMLRELTRYPTMRLDAIVIYEYKDESDALVNLVQSRLSDAAHRPICALWLGFRGSKYGDKYGDNEEDNERIYEIERSPNTQWLRSHVAEVKTLVRR